jgi:DNA-binding beta-propeller fold protein YncE
VFLSTTRFVLAFLSASLLSIAAGAQQSSPLSSAGRIELSDVNGRIDHFSADVKGGRLLLSALGNHTVEVLDARSNKRIHTIRDLAEPQGVLYDADSNRIIVACAGDGSVNVFDGTSYNRINRVTVGDDNDNVRYDVRSKQFLVGYTNGLALFDSAGKQTANIPLDGHAESFQLEKRGTRAFVNVPTKQEIEVVDLDKKSVVGRWPFKNERRNYPMSLDEEHHRLFVGFRDPARLLVINTETGQTVPPVDIVGDTDDLFYDAEKRRIYVIGGEGFVDVIEQDDADHYQRIDRIKTASGARTGYFVPDWNKLFVGVPHRGSQQAGVLVFDTK